MSKNLYHGIDKYAVDQIQYHARRLARNPLLVGYDIEDLEQELMLCYLGRIKSYDPEKAGWKTFTSLIISKKAISIIRKANSQRRKQRTGHAACDEWLSQISILDGSASLDWDSEYLNHQDLRMDCERIMSHIPLPLLNLLADIKKFPMLDIEYKHLLSPYLLGKRVALLRCILKKRGLDKYFS